MIRGESFKIKYNPSKNCYLHFAGYWLRQFNDLKCPVRGLKLEYDNKKVAYVSWSPFPDNSTEQREVSISSTFAQRLGIKNKDTVLISYCSNIPAVEKVYVSPLTTDDWELLETNSVKLQSTLLNQIHVVFETEVFVAWVSRNVSVSLRVDSLEPLNQVGHLENFTEIIVNDPPSKSTSNRNSAIQPTTPDVTDQNGTTSSAIWDSVKRLGSFLNVTITEEEANMIDLPVKQKPDDERIQAIVKCLPYQKLLYRLQLLQCNAELFDENGEDEVLFQPYNAFVCERDFPRIPMKHSEFIIYRLSVVPFQHKVVKEYANISLPVEENKIDNKTVSKNNLFLKVFCLENVMNSVSDSVRAQVKKHAMFTAHRPLFVSETVLQTLNVLPGAKLILEPIPIDSSQSLTEIQLSTNVNTEEKDDTLIENFNEFVVKYSKKHLMLINSGALFPVCVSKSKKHVLLSIFPNSLQYYLINSEYIEHCTVKALHSSEVPSEFVRGNENEHTLKTKFKCSEWQTNLLTEGLATLEVGLNCGMMPQMQPLLNWNVQNILILGKSGSGRSTLAKRLCSTVEDAPYFMHVVEISCKHLRGKTVDTVQRILLSAFAECIYYQPSVLLLDDLDTIASSVKQEHMEHTYYDRVGEIFSKTIEDIQRFNNIFVLATAVELGTINLNISQPDGIHIFKTVLEIPELNKDARLDTLKDILLGTFGDTPSLLTEDDLKQFANQTEGYVLQDLVDLAEKSVFESWKRLAHGTTPQIEACDLANALQKNIPLALRDVKLQHSSSHSWDDVGGLSKVKEMLIELFHWPSQFPELFEQSPLRHQSGVLLYGAPGTGKTLLAGALAQQCGLKFISIKGPELLSKYIGASEEAVRNLFVRAQSAKPCLLFFDEFDSLAPRRGHDSTGVTDRVVNQLLTQLDGVEGLHGVWMLAATSRPDLLDPALLRPGRLDHTILCPLPTKEERLSILKVLSQKITLSNEVELKEIAQEALGFTGADLQAVLYTAQIMALEEQQDIVKGEENFRELHDINASQKSMATPIITQGHLMTALKNTRPSLSPAEKGKYDAIYRKFQKSRSGSLKDKQKTEKMVQKATLA